LSACCGAKLRERDVLTHFFFFCLTQHLSQ
jgi:hypothetical protein